MTCYGSTECISGKHLVTGKRTDDPMAVTMKMITFLNVMPCSLRKVYRLQRNPLPYITYPDCVHTRTHTYLNVGLPLLVGCHPHQKNLNFVLNGKLQEVKFEILIVSPCILISTKLFLPTNARFIKT